MKLFDRGRDHVLTLFRIVLGFLFFCHGASMVFGLWGHHAAPTGQWPGWWAALIQLVGGALVALGIGTRAAAVICSGSRAFAYFAVHAGSAVLPIENGGEQAAIFAWAFLLLAFTGGGTWSLADAFRRAPLPAS
ncbi:DoxX family protein [Amycolatopsis sp. FDAARGOS 1241]|uniref:DoxX family protein n=1 Tax=Amycolatopsis sp. FDAARGOS 1241 TaxID=2778070 RepID=UPI001EF39673|nr:DoxX family protein [Amycolatopsis sp. FDAARGOS 1241]